MEVQHSAGPDRAVLEFAAQHRLILPAHLQSLLGISAPTAARRLRALARDGDLIARRVFVGQPACYQITRAGLTAIQSTLPSPRFDVRAYTHDVGVAWLWLASRRGAFGPVREVLAERVLRSSDARQGRLGMGGGDPLRGGDPLGGDDPLGQPFGVRLGGFGANGRERLHYPDLLLIAAQGARIAVELELTSKGRGRRERILAGYGADARISAVLYLVDQRGAARAIRDSARRLGIESLVQVQWVRPTFTPAGRAPPTTLERASARRSPSRGAQR